MTSYDGYVEGKNFEPHQIWGGKGEVIPCELLRELLVLSSFDGINRDALMPLPEISLIPVNLASLRFKVKLGCEEEFETMWRYESVLPRVDVNFDGIFRPIDGIFNT